MALGYPALDNQGTYLLIFCPGCNLPDALQRPLLAPPSGQHLQLRGGLHRPEGGSHPVHQGQKRETQQRKLLNESFCKCDGESKNETYEFLT